MGISLTSPPSPLSFSGNNIVAGFTCTEIYTQVGVKSVNSILLPDDVLPEDTIVIKYGNNSITFTAAVAPDNSGEQYYATTVGASVPWLWKVDCFRANYIISQDFDITTVDNNLIFTAKRIGLGYDIQGYNVTPGAAEIIKPNYGIQFRLFCESADYSGYEIIYQQRINVSFLEGKAEAPINNNLHDYIAAELSRNLPDIPATAIINCKKSCRKYYFEYCESYGEPIKAKKVYKSPVYTVIFGGLSYKRNLTANLTNLLAPGAISEDRFLSQAPMVQSTRSNQQQFLYFLNTRATVTAKVRCIFYFRDESSETADLYTSELVSNRKYAFNVTFDLIFIPAEFADKVVYKYEIFLIDQDGAQISEKKTFWMDYSPKEFVRYFLNYSSWGTLDSRMFCGKGSVEFELTQSEATKIHQGSPDIRSGTSIVYDLSLRTKYALTTGFMASREVLLFNRDFFLSAFKWRNVKGHLLPVKVTSKTIPELDDKSNLFAQNFEYEFLFDDSFYTYGDIEEPGIVIEGNTPGPPRKESVKIYNKEGLLIATVQAPGEYHITTDSGSCIPTFAYVTAPNNQLEL